MSGVQLLEESGACLLKPLPRPGLRTRGRPADAEDILAEVPAEDVLGLQRRSFDETLVAALDAVRDALRHFRTRPGIKLWPDQSLSLDNTAFVVLDCQAGTR